MNARNDGGRRIVSYMSGSRSIELCAGSLLQLLPRQWANGEVMNFGFDDFLHEVHASVHLHLNVYFHAFMRNLGIMLSYSFCLKLILPLLRRKKRQSWLAIFAS